MSEANNILPQGTGKDRKEKLSEEKLLLYLEGKLSAAEQHEVEQWIADEGMESDALEGLRIMKPDETRHTVNRLNHSLRKTLLHKKHRRRPLKTDYFTIIALAVILMLVIIAYIVIRKSI